MLFSLLGTDWLECFISYSVLSSPNVWTRYSFQHVDRTDSPSTRHMFLTWFWFCYLTCIEQPLSLQTQGSWGLLWPTDMFFKFCSVLYFDLVAMFKYFEISWKNPEFCLLLGKKQPEALRILGFTFPHGNHHLELRTPHRRNNYALVSIITFPNSWV